MISLVRLDLIECLTDAADGEPQLWPFSSERCSVGVGPSFLMIGRQL